MAKDFTIKQGNTRPFLKAILIRLDENGEPELDEVGEPVVADLTDADTVTFTMKNKAGGTIQVDEGACSISGDPTLGVVVYEWQAGDTDIAGKFQGEFDITYTDDTTETIPNGIAGFEIKIVAQLSV